MPEAKLTAPPALITCSEFVTLPRPTLELVRAAVETAVTNPFPFTVIIGTDVIEPKEPTLLLTVANVPVIAVVPEPVKSPLSVIVWLPVKYDVFDAAVT